MECLRLLLTGSGAEVFLVKTQSRYLRLVAIVDFRGPPNGAIIHSIFAYASTTRMPPPALCLLGGGGSSAAHV